MSECNSFSEHIHKPGKCVFYISGDNQVGFCSKPSEFRCIQDLNDQNPDLSYSSVADWLICKQLYWYKHIQGIEVRESKRSGAMKMGSLWDSALSIILGSGSMEDFQAAITLYRPTEFEEVKVRAVARAYKNLNIEVSPAFNLQRKFKLPIDISDLYPNENIKTFVISGVFDRLYSDYFTENKFTSRPDLYEDKYFHSAQIATYFMANPDLKYAVMELIRTPELKITGQYQNETAADHLTRCYEDILRRPSYYFIGYDSTTRIYGKKYYRSEYEFLMFELEKRYKHIAYEIRDTYKRGQGTSTLTFYRNDKACHFPWACDYLPICRGEGSVSEELYRIRGKEGVEGNLIQLLTNNKKEKAKQEVKSENI